MKDKVNWLYIAVFFFLVCFFMQLYNFQMIWMLVGCGILCICFLIKQKTIRIDLGIIFLAITMYSFYIIQYGVRAVVTMIPYVPMVMYVLSSYYAGDLKKDSTWEKKFLAILFSFIIGYAIHGILNSYMYYAGYIKQGTRQWYDFWSQSYLPATQHSLLYLPMLALVFPAIVWLRKEKIKNIVILILSFLFLYTSVVTKSRIPILIAAMVFCGEAVLYFVLEGKIIRKIFSDKKTCIDLYGIIFAIVIIGFFAKDIELIRTFIDSFSRGGGILHNVRFEVQAKALQQLFDYPMGGHQMDLFVDYDRMYIHNVWLDMANASGLIPFFAFVIFTVYSIINLLLFLKKKDISTEIKIVTTGLYMTFFLFYSVEPALDSSIYYMTPWMMINGLIQGTLSKGGIKLNFLRRSTNEG